MNSTVTPSIPEFPREPQFPIQRLTVERAAEYLTQGCESRGRLGCADCVTTELCAAVVTALTRSSRSRRVPGMDVNTLRGYGIQVDEGGHLVCPGRLVMRAVSSEIGGEFCVASDDALNKADPYTRIAEVLRASTESLLAQLDKNVRI